MKSSLVNWTLRDCALHGGKVIIGEPDTGVFWGIELGYYYGASAVEWENNLFDGVSVLLDPTSIGYGYVNCDVAFINTLGTPQYVVFARTNAASLGQSFLNGAPFGLVSVDLADPVAPSLSPIGITFNGYRADGSMVSQTFTTPGSGSSFQTHFFNPVFASDLVRVEMPSPAWAMDNVVWVPEPTTWTLLLLGGGALVYVRSRKHNS
jgi:hypothetical protein